ncbi:MAG: C4-type zinc ribbon domain-containing protein [Bacteroidales bacterium]|nr:C4-type zinc ribbon domain-containing protein [Bacteroidales bacterium]
MATAKQEKELTVEERLKALYQLQTTLSEIDRIKTLRGELPLEVNDLEDEIEGLNTRVNNLDEEIKNINEEIVKQKEVIGKSTGLVDRYSEQINNVKNNREYDYLQKEIEYEKLNIELAEKKIRQFGAKIEEINAQIEDAKSKLEDKKHILVEKKNELDEIVSETKQDEEKLRETAKKYESKIDSRLLAAFKRIRKNARNGLGVVYVQRNACGGCFNRIPAQRQMEIKMHKKIIVCEYCGRILIDPEMAGFTEEAAGNVRK